MKAPALLAGLMVGLMALSSAAPAATYTIDPTHTVVTFDLPIFALSTQRGRFDRKSGSVSFDAAAHTGNADIVIDTTSVNTGVAALDRTVQLLLDAEQQPQARFVSQRFVFDGDTVTEVPGTLSLHGHSQPLTLKATRFGCYLNPLFRRQVCGGDFEATLSRRAWALDGAADAGFGDAVRLIVQIEAIAQ